MKRQSLILTNLLLSLPVAAGLLYAAPSASAQSGTSAVIPFAFSANKVQAPAGTYKVERLTSFLLSLQNEATGETQFVTIFPEGGRVIQTHGGLVFHRDGTQYSLTQVNFAGSSFAGELAVRPKLRHEMASINGRPTGSTAASNTSSTIEVAMK